MARKVKMNSPDEDARITAAADADPDNPPLSESDFAGAKRVSPERAAEMERRFRGPQRAPTKIRTTIALDPDVIAHFKADGRGWQTRINAALREIAGLADKAG